MNDGGNWAGACSAIIIDFWVSFPLFSVGLFYSNYVINIIQFIVFF